VCGVIGMADIVAPKLPITRLLLIFIDSIVEGSQAVYVNVENPSFVGLKGNFSN
jgi:hypothetical protein